MTRLAQEKRILGLDELRGVAVILVVVHHIEWLLGNYQLGGPSVDLFFILSGFLIGRILLLSKDREDYFSRFYGRRVFRIGPLALAMIVFCFVLSITIGRNTDSWTYYLFFVQNYIPPQVVDGSHPDWSGPLAGADPLWSLAVEEHFYLIIPLVVRYLPEKCVIAFCFVIGLISVAAKNQYLAVHGGYDLLSNPQRTECRAVYLVAGLMMNYPKQRYVFIVVVGLSWLLAREFFGTSVGKLDLAVFLILFLVVDLTRLQKFRPRLKWLAFLGKLCFSIYLVHMPISLVLKQTRLVESAMLNLSIYFGATLALSVASFYLFEEPVRRWGYRWLEKRASRNAVVGEV